MFIRRLGESEQSRCESGYHCSQLLEMADGDFAAVGLDITDEAIPAMPLGPGVGPKERVVAQIPADEVQIASTEECFGRRFRAIALRTAAARFGSGGSTPSSRLSAVTPRCLAIRAKLVTAKGKRPRSMPLRVFQ